ncbi:hypothetical protein DR999_PMT08325 [Platysternon megacephalum]|uniref:Uncharacterized protein n=1 Tax=Platysternon megacephalum TaxID=55544 RepID=A0A4D9ESE5_9SAUR|nr:hypothetical protein DR999_PMT08325 [Platysternon megacephalum]
MLVKKHSAALELAAATRRIVLFLSPMLLCAMNSRAQSGLRWFPQRARELPEPCYRVASLRVSCNRDQGHTQTLGHPSLAFAWLPLPPPSCASSPFLTSASLLVLKRLPSFPAAWQIIARSDGFQLQILLLPAQDFPAAGDWGEGEDFDSVAFYLIFPQLGRYNGMCSPHKAADTKELMMITSTLPAGQK